MIKCFLCDLVIERDKYIVTQFGELICLGCAVAEGLISEKEIEGVMPE